MRMKICVLGSGSSGNSTYLETKHTKILIDAGLPFHLISSRLAELGVGAEEIDAILLTHSHIDHIRSAFAFGRRFGTPIFATPETERLSKQKLGNFPCQFFKFEEKIEDLEVIHFPVSHSKEHGENTVNFVIYSGGSKYAHLTDLGSYRPEIVELVRGADCIQVEANYEESIVARKLNNPEYAREWQHLEWIMSPLGHLSNTQCSEFLSLTATEKTKHVFLAHLSENHKEPKKDNNSYYIARRKVSQCLRQFGLRPCLHRTFRYGPRESKKSDVVRI